MQKQFMKDLSIHTLNAQIEETANKYGASIVDSDNEKVVELIRNKNIVTLFQGKSENGPRALGNRSILFDPTFEDGKRLRKQRKT